MVEEQTDRPVALVTGASYGLGAEIAKTLARDTCDKRRGSDYGWRSRSWSFAPTMVGCSTAERVKLRVASTLSSVTRFERLAGAASSAGSCSGELVRGALTPRGSGIGLALEKRTPLPPERHPAGADVSHFVEKATS